MSKLLDLLSGGWGSGIKVGAVFVLALAWSGYLYRTGVTHERKLWTDAKLVETVAQQKLDIAARDAAIASLAATAQAAQANTARRATETQSLKATIEKLKTKPSPCRLDSDTVRLLNDYANGKAPATNAATDNH